MKSSAFRTLCRFLIITVFAMFFGPANARMVDVGQIAQAGAPQSQRAALQSLVAREDVARELQAHGIDPAAAHARIATMTDAEVETLQGRVDALPAGASFGGSGFDLLGYAVIALFVWLVSLVFIDLFKKK
jgi:hypothetical protein